jgi:hypothetical protein
MILVEWFLCGIGIAYLKISSGGVMPLISGLDCFAGSQAPTGS